MVPQPHALDFDVVDLLDPAPMFQEMRGEFAIVREEDQTGGGVFEIADGIDALGESAQEIAKRFAAFGISEAGNNFGRFVEEQIDFALLLSCDLLSGHFDFVGGGIGFGAEFSDSFAVHADLSGTDELFGVAAGSDAGPSDDFL